MPTPETPASQDLSQLWNDCYGDLKVLARSRLRRSSEFTLLDATGLVNQSWLRLMESNAGVRADNRAQFFAYASTVMRSVIVDLARERMTQRRGSGDVMRLDTRLGNELVAVDDDDPLFVSEALDALRLREPRLAQIVEMRFFGGLTEVEIAEVLELSERTVRSDWQKARVLMRMLLRPA